MAKGVELAPVASTTGFEAHRLVDVHSVFHISAILIVQLTNLHHLRNPEQQYMGKFHLEQSNKVYPTDQHSDPTCLGPARFPVDVDFQLVFMNS